MSPYKQSASQRDAGINIVTRASIAKSEIKSSVLCQIPAFSFQLFLALFYIQKNRLKMPVFYSFFALRTMSIIHVQPSFLGQKAHALHDLFHLIQMQVLLRSQPLQELQQKSY